MRNFQEVVNLFEFYGDIGPGVFVETQDLTEPNPLLRGIPIVGYVLIYGQVYSSQTALVEVMQGTIDNGPTFVYDWIVNFNVLAGITMPREIPVEGKYAKVRITNTSVNPAIIRGYFNVRSYE